MLYCFLQIGNFFLKSIHTPVGTSIVRRCFCGCTKGDTYLVTVAPSLLGVKTLSLDRNVQIQKLAQNQRLIELQPRADIGNIAHNTVDSGAATFKIYEGSQKAFMSRRTSFFSHTGCSQGHWLPYQRPKRRVGLT